MTWGLWLLFLGGYMLGMMPIVKATEREWRDFGIFWIVVLTVIGADHFIRTAWEILER